MTAHVYTYWRDTTPLYVGVTADVLRRMDQHTRKGKPWTTRATHITVRDYTVTADAYAAEIDTIQRLEPIYNKSHNPRHQRLAAPYMTPAELAKADYHAAMVIDRLLSRRAS